MHLQRAMFEVKMATHWQKIDFAGTSSFEPWVRLGAHSVLIKTGLDHLYAQDKISAVERRKQRLAAEAQTWLFPQVRFHWFALLIAVKNSSDHRTHKHILSWQIDLKQSMMTMYRFRREMARCLLMMLGVNFETFSSSWALKVKSFDTGLTFSLGRQREKIFWDSLPRCSEKPSLPLASIPKRAVQNLLSNLEIDFTPQQNSAARKCCRGALSGPHIPINQALNPPIKMISIYCYSCPNENSPNLEPAGPRTRQGWTPWFKLC